MSCKGDKASLEEGRHESLYRQRDVTELRYCGSEIVGIGEQEGMGPCGSAWVLTTGFCEDDDADSGVAGLHVAAHSTLYSGEDWVLALTEEFQDSPLEAELSSLGSDFNIGVRRGWEWD